LDVTNVAVLKTIVLLKVQLFWSFKNSTPDLFFLNHGFAWHWLLKPWFLNTLVLKNYNTQTGPEAYSQTLDMCTPRLLWIPEHVIHIKIPRFTLAHRGPLQYSQRVSYCWRDAHYLSRNCTCTDSSWPQAYGNWNLQLDCFNFTVLLIVTLGCSLKVRDRVRTNLNIKGLFTQVKYLCQNKR
jgi:hypothetical protein